MPRGACVDNFNKHIYYICTFIRNVDYQGNINYCIIIILRVFLPLTVVLKIKYITCVCLACKSSHILVFAMIRQMVGGSSIVIRPV